MLRQGWNPPKRLSESAKAQTNRFKRLVCAFAAFGAFLRGRFTPLKSTLGNKGAILVVAFLLVPLSVLFSAVNPTPAHATASTYLNFQGRLLSSAGNLVADGNYNIQFNLYDGGTAGGPAGSGAANAGTNYWTESRLVSATQGITVKNGFFSVTLGSITAFPSTIDWDQQLWLGMTVRGTTSCVFGSCSPTDAEMAPRFQLTSVPLAFSAAQLQKSASPGGFTTTVNINTPTANRAILFPDAGGTAVLQTGTYTTNGVIYANAASTTLSTAAGTTGQCLVAVTSSAPVFSTCAGAGSGSTLQAAYDNSTNPATILTADNKNIVFSLQDTATDSNFLVNINTSSTGKFAVQSNGTDVLTATSTALTIAENTSISGANTLTVGSGLTQLGGALTVGGTATFNGSASVSGANTFTVGTGLTSLGGGLTVTSGGNIAFQKAADISTTGSLNNQAVTGGLVRFTGASAQTLTGIASGSDGRILTLVNAAATALIINNNDTVNSSVGNRIITGTGANVSVASGSSLTLVYDATGGVTIWRVVGDVAGGSGAGITSVGAINGTSTVNGASITGSTLNLAVADNTNGGVVSNTTQTFLGAKTFTNLLTGNAGAIIGGGAIALTGNAASSFTTSAGALTLTSAAATTWSTAAGTLTLQGFGGTTLNTPTAATTSAISLLTGVASAGASGAVTLATGTGTTSTGLISLTTGNASAGTAGNISIDNGTSTSGTPQINIGNSANVRAISIGNTTTGTSLTERVGTGNYSLDGNLASTYDLGASTTTGTIAIGGTAQSTGALTLGRSTDTNTVNIATGVTASGKTQTINIGTGGAAGSTTTTIIGSIIAGNITLQSASTINLNAGTIVGTATTQNLFNTVATTVNAFGASTTTVLGATTGTLTVRNANQTFGNAAGSGLFTNNGATQSATLDFADQPTGLTFTASTSIDIYTAITVNQTTASQTITIPAATAGAGGRGRVLYLSNRGSVAFTVAPSGGTNFVLNPTSTATFYWNGAAWTNAGVDGGSASYIQNQSGSAQTASYWISASGRSDTSFIAPALERGTAGTLSLGTTANTTGVVLGNTTNVSSLAINGANGSTLSVGDNAVAGMTINIGGVSNSASDTVNIATNATASDAVLIGSTNAGSTSKIQAGATSLNIANAGVTLQTTTNSLTAFQIQNSSSANLLTVDTINNLIVTTAHQESIGQYNNSNGGIGQTQNLLTFSEQFDNAAWTKTTVTATANTIAGPDNYAGFATPVAADTLATTGAGGSIKQAYTTATIGNYTFSVWLKTASGTQNVDLRIDATGTSAQTGTVKTVTANTTWQRYWVSQNITGPTISSVVANIFPGGTAGSSAVTEYAYGAQLNQTTTMLVYTRTTTNLQAQNQGVISNGGLFASALDLNDKPLVVQGAPSQSADLLTVQDSAAANLFKISSTGLATSSTGFAVGASAGQSLACSGGTPQATITTIAGGIATAASCTAASNLTGAGANGRVSFWTGASTLSSSALFNWDNTNGNLGLGTAAPTSLLDVAQPTTGVGTVSNGAAGTTVTGLSTQFTNTFKVGDTITIGGQTVAISAIASDTSMTTASITSANSNVAYTLTAGTRFSVKGNGNVGIGTTTPARLLTLNTSSATVNSTLLLSNTDNTIGTGTGLLINMNDSASATQTYGGLSVKVSSNTAGSYVGSLSLRVSVAGSLTDVLNIVGSDTAIGTIPVTGRALTVNGILGTSAGNRLQLVSSGNTNLWNIDNSAGTLRIFRENYAATGTGTGGLVKLSITDGGDATFAGNVTVASGSATAPSLNFAGATTYGLSYVNNLSGMPWSNGPNLSGAGWSYYDTNQAAYKMGFRNSAAGQRYLWNADNTMLGTPPNDSLNTATLYVNGTETVSSTLSVGTNINVGNANMNSNQFYCAGGVACYYNWSGTGATNIGNSAGVTIAGGVTAAGNQFSNGTDSWLRTSGATGWYNSTYAGGMYMTGTNFVEIYNGKGLLTTGNIFATQFQGKIVNSSSGTLQLNWNNSQGGVEVGNGSSGYGNAWAAAWLIGSSRTLKHDIQNTTYGLAELTQLQPVSYIYNNDPTNTTRLGLISEDTRPIIPEVTTWNPTTQTYGIDYGQFTGVLINGIKQLKVITDGLDARLAVVEAGNFRGNLSVVGDVTVGGTLKVTGRTMLTTLTVTGDTEVQKLTINGKIITAGTAPTAAVGTAAGNILTATASVTGNDTAGTVIFTAGTTGTVANDILGNITFSTPYTQPPIVTVSPTTEDSASIRYFLIKTTTGWSIKVLDAPTAGKTYSFDYHVIQ